MLDRIQAVGASLGVQQEQPLSPKILPVKGTLLGQRVTDRQDAAEADLRQFPIDGGLFLVPYKCKR